MLGSTSDVPCVATQRAVTPVVAYLGRVDIATMQGLNALEGKSPTMMALSLEKLLSADSVEARLVPGIGPMPVFNANATHGEMPMEVWGLSAQVLHGVMRVVVGARREYVDVLYSPLTRKSRTAGGGGGGA